MFIVPGLLKETINIFYNIWLLYTFDIQSIVIENYLPLHITYSA